MRADMKLRISATMANEWAVRCIGDVIEGMPEFEYSGGELNVSDDVAKQIAADCEYMIDRDGPDMTIGERSAYRALLKQIIAAA